ncbi:hypothetical protein [Salipiger bermudensis]|uniref:hypothetical protein n=1 Tax=Salipiger bermudensis TaxID=344736 RepID=UPI001A8F8EDB|nr:hypothetical protein [Salipiger bermudensis]MBN9676480.1 hypothetical protein [Salipiger bermudensis]
MVDTQDCDDGDDLDQLMLATVDERQSHSTLIVCFFTGEGAPPHTAAMLRVPAPPIASSVMDSFHVQIDAAIELNPAVHDGAILVGRSRTSEDYAIRGWSYRLFPPHNGACQEANRGSAFNSGLAMSTVEGIDAVYLASNNTVSKFVHGHHILLR